MVLKKLLLISLNYCYDAITYIQHSSVFTGNSQAKIEGKIGFYYHSIEKGLINDPIRYRFAESKIKRLISYLNTWLDRKYETDNSQFISACSVLVKYYNLHKENDIDISDLISVDNNNIFNFYNNEKIGGVINISAKSYFQNSQARFDLFSNSRRSVRHFGSQIIPITKIKEIVKVAKNSPSVCNRQSVKLIFINNKELARKVLNIQLGLNSEAQTINQLFVVTSDRGYFVSEGERNQLFVDGGIFLMNLLYSLHFNNIAACPLHCALNFYDEIKMKKLLKFKPSIKIIAFVAVGYPGNYFRVPYSNRKEISEVLEILD